MKIAVMGAGVIGCYEDRQLDRKKDVLAALWKKFIFITTDLQNGNRLELEWLNGLMVKLGEEIGVAMPCHRAMMMARNLHAAGKSGEANREPVDPPLSCCLA